jgi:lipoprotein NlpI
MLGHIAAVAVLLGAGAPLPADADPWLGKQVMPKREDVRLRQLDAKGKEVKVARKEAVYTVAEVKGADVRLIARGQSGWGSRDDWMSLADAPAHYAEAIRANPADTFGWNYRGIARKARGELDGAMKDFEQVVKLEPKAAWAHLNVGNVWSLKRDHDRAIQAFDKALQLNPNYATAYLSRGNSWKEKGDPEKALKDYTELIRLQPKNPTGYNQRANLLVERGDHDAAIKDYTEAHRHDPTHPGSIYNRSRLWTYKGEYQKALDDLNVALRLNPKFEYALAGKARLLATCPQEKYRNGKLAVKLASQACEITRWKEGDSLDALAAGYAEVGDFEKALLYQKKALEDKRFASEWAEEARARLDLYARKMPRRDSDR